MLNLCKILEGAISYEKNTSIGAINSKNNPSIGAIN